MNWSEAINGWQENGISVDKLEYSFHIGLNYRINENFYLNTRLSNSIVPIRPHSSGQTYSWNKGQYNTSISFVLYYYFGEKIKR